jgi:hypothetical protein
MKKEFYIFIPALLVLAFLLWLSSATRLSFDDYALAACFKTKSLPDAFEYLYNSYAFRWTSFLTECLVLGLVPANYYPISIFVFFLVLYTAWILSLMALTKKLMQKYGSVALSQLQTFSVAVLAIGIFYFAASQAVESFTSVIVVADRLVPLVFLTMAANALWSEKKSSRLLLALLAILIAGSAENITISILAVVFPVVFYQSAMKKDALPKKLLLFGCMLVLFFALEFFSKGRISRYMVEKRYHFTCGMGGVYCPDTFIAFLKRFFIARQGAVLLFSIVFFIFASLLPEQARRALKKPLKRLTVYLLICLVPVAILHFVSARVVFECYGPMRMWLPVNILLAVLVMLTAIRLGIGAQLKNQQALKVSIALILSGFLVFYFIRHFPETNAYARAYDQRAALVLNSTSAVDVVELPALPPSGLVVAGDIMTDERDDVNRDFKNTYCLPFGVKRK